MVLIASDTVANVSGGCLVVDEVSLARKIMFTGVEGVSWFRR
jgi:hypothetical protein